MADPITIDIEVEGGDEGARAVDRLAGSTRGLGTASQGTTTAVQAQARAQAQATAAQTAASTQAIAFTQKISAAANAVQSLVGQLGGGSRAAGLIGATTAAAAAGAQLGASFGPGGAVVGGILGATIPAIQAMISETNNATQAMSEFRSEAAQAATAFADAMSESRRLAARRSGDLSSLDTADLAQEIRERREDLLRGGDPSLTPQAREALSRRTLRQLDAAQAEAERREREPAPTSTGRSGFGPGFRDRALESGLSRTGDREPPAAGAAADPEAIRSDEEYNRAVQAIVDQEKALADARDEAHSAYMEGQREKLDILQEIAALEYEQANKAALEAQTQADIEGRERDKQKEYLEQASQQLSDLNAEKKAAYEQQVAEIQGVTEVVTGGMIEAFTALATGQKTAEQAFAGLLASFLQYIAERAALEAASEAAQAIASFARYDYSGGAMHLAAAGAFVGVAVAAGAGSVALSSAAQGPAPVDRSASQGGGGAQVSGDIVVNFNSPVVTAGTRAELGQELRATIGAAERRYGT